MLARISPPLVRVEAATEHATLKNLARFHYGYVVIALVVLAVFGSLGVGALAIRSFYRQCKMR